MSLAIIHSRAAVGIYAPPVTVEAHLSNGLPGFSIVGLPEAAVKESKDRVRSALLNSNFEFPTRRITINLAPADLPKEGGRFDLPIALGILAASGQIPQKILNEYEFAGELALSGELRPIHGVLCFALTMQRSGRKLILPWQNKEEAILAKDLIFYPAKHLLEVCAHLTQDNPLPRLVAEPLPTKVTQHLDLADVQGQLSAKRALEIAASGGHSLLFIGPPGTGKTMLANRLLGILPLLDEKAALEVAMIHSSSGKNFKLEHWLQRPFRAPHHTASSVALVGGGNPPKPGEISLAHQGILFLDELPEFNRHVLEALREPLESGVITLSRAACQAEFPAKFQLIAAMNPCPCGQAGNPQAYCRCSPEQIQRYRARLSGPLLDRIDMHVEVMPVPATDLIHASSFQENSHTIRARVEQTRQQQLQKNHCLNGELSGKVLEQTCALIPQDKDFLDHAMKQLGLSARAYYRILRVARTIADLAASTQVTQQHLAEALNYRRLERSIKS